MKNQESFTLNGRNFHGTEALNKCISAIIADGHTVQLVNVTDNYYKSIKIEFGEKVTIKN